MPIDKPDTFAYTRHEPVGVVAALTAWNSPLLFVAWKCAAALAAGCTVVVKPSEFTSASTLEFAALTKEAGIPAGVFNVVTGFGPEIGTRAGRPSRRRQDHLHRLGHDRRAKVYETAARSLKRVSLELGGKSPNIVFEDADLDAAAAGAISGIFAATGQTCIAGSRLLVQNSIKDKFVERVLELGAVARKIGDPDAIGYQDRPGHHAAAVQEDPRLYRHREGGRRALPARRRAGLGRRHRRAASSSSRPSSPTSTTRMRIAREEVFGPVLSIIGFDTEEDAIRIANDTIYGLAAGRLDHATSARAIRVPKRCGPEPSGSTPTAPSAT